MVLALILLPFILLFLERNVSIYIHMTCSGITRITVAFLIALFFCFKWQRANSFIVLIV